jgi:hypothetical protein
METEWLTAIEAAQYLKVKPRTLLQWVRERKIPAHLSLAKIPSACVFIAFQLARFGRSRRLLTVKISRHLFNFSTGWSFGEAQVRAVSSSSPLQPWTDSSNPNVPCHSYWNRPLRSMNCRRDLEQRRTNPGKSAAGKFSRGHRIWVVKPKTGLSNGENRPERVSRATPLETWVGDLPTSGPTTSN